MGFRLLSYVLGTLWSVATIGLADGADSTALAAVIHPQSAAARSLMPGTPAEEVTAFVGATLIDGNGGPPLSDATLVVRGPRIAALGPRAEVAVPRGARVIEASGKFITPGLIMTNYHMIPGNLTWPQNRQEYDQLAVWSARGVQAVLKQGITTVRSSYGYLPPYQQVQAAMRRGEFVGARLLVAGNIVGWGGPASETMSGITPETEWHHEINALMTQGAGEELLTLSPDSLRVAINAYLDKGPDFIKYGATSHRSAADTVPIFTAAQQAVIVDAAHRRGRRVGTHATGAGSVRTAVLAGVDIIQHPEMGSRDDALARLLAERQVICSVNSLSAAQLFPGCRPSVAVDAFLPPVPASGSVEEFERGVHASVLEIFKDFHRAVAAGMSPGQVIVAATKHGALACGALQDYGTLEVGKLADLLVLAADPLVNVEHFSRLALVMKEGKLIDRGPGLNPSVPQVAPAAASGP